MNRLEFSKAIQELHAPLQRQQIRTNAIGAKFGAGSVEYKTEVKKEANITLSLSPKEHEIWCQFCIFLFKEAIQNGTLKEKVLADIVEIGKHMEESKKPKWRNVYQQIKAV